MPPFDAAPRILRLLSAAALLLAGCTAIPLEPRTVLDPRSGTRLTVVDQPLVLARERRDVAVQAREYLTMLAAEINESGHHHLVWVVHHWSTIDTRAAEIEHTPDAPLLLIADGRDLQLMPIGNGAASAYLENPALRAPDDTHAHTTLYAVDPATLEYVATSRYVAAVFPQSRLALPFVLWTDGRPAIARFLATLGPR